MSRYAVVDVVAVAAVCGAGHLRRWLHLFEDGHVLLILRHLEGRVELGVHGRTAQLGAQGRPQVCVGRGVVGRAPGGRVGARGMWGLRGLTLGPAVRDVPRPRPLLTAVPQRQRRRPAAAARRRRHVGLTSVSAGPVELVHFRSSRRPCARTVGGLSGGARRLGGAGHDGDVHGGGVGRGGTWRRCEVGTTATPPVLRLGGRVGRGWLIGRRVHEHTIVTVVVRLFHHRIL